MKPLGRAQSGLARWDMGKALVALQVALSLALVAGAGPLLASWRRAAILDPGFRPEGVLIAEVNGRPLRLPPAQRHVFYNSILDRLRAIPGVSAVSVSGRTPFSDQTMALEVSAPYAPNGAHTIARFNLVSE